MKLEEHDRCWRKEKSPNEIQLVGNNGEAGGLHEVQARRRRQVARRQKVLHLAPNVVRLAQHLWNYKQKPCKCSACSCVCLSFLPVPMYP